MSCEARDLRIPALVVVLSERGAPELAQPAQRRFRLEIERRFGDAMFPK
jgi:hypothetical protein